MFYVYRSSIDEWCCNIVIDMFCQDDVASGCEMTVWEHGE